VQRYDERFRIGYRGHDASGIAPLFPFGHGLSYGAVRWGQPHASARRIARDEGVTVTVPLEASGERDATVVVQGYVAPVAPPVEREAKALRTWQKTVVPAGARRAVELDFTPAAFRRWDAAQGGWVVDPGDYDLVIAASAGDERARLRVAVR
jgi:beta-glucosidase